MKPAVLRSVTLTVALAVLAAACALIEPPPPPGTTRVVAEVTNLEPFEVQLAVTTPGGVLAGAVQPDRLTPHGAGEMTFYLPPGDNWTITVNGTAMFFGEGFDGCAGGGTLSMEVSADGHGSIGCRTP